LYKKLVGKLLSKIGCLWKCFPHNYWDFRPFFPKKVPCITILTPTFFFFFVAIMPKLAPPPPPPTKKKKTQFHTHIQITIMAKLSSIGKKFFFQNGLKYVVFLVKF
jgi:hypothetical protein